MKTKIEVGQKYNRLTVLEKLGYDKYNNRMYRCICDCGNEIVLRGTAFTSGNTKSCGCLSREVKKSKRLPNNRAVINQIILQYKRHARDRGLDWNLTYEQVEKIVQEPCFYCGAERSNHKVTKNCKEGYDHNGIDRIDSGIGYEPNNVVPCCKICNYAKRAMSYKEFVSWATKVAEHSSNGVNSLWTTQAK